jgi:hypothetical protein
MDLKFIQKTHTHQVELEKLLKGVKLKFWLPLDHMLYESDHEGGKSFCFCVCYENPDTGQQKLVKFKEELSEDNRKTN